MPNLTQDEIWRILEAKNDKGESIHQDVLTPLAKREDSFFRHAQCPSCHSNATETFVDPRRPFSTGSPLPNRLVRCLECKVEFNPYTNLITRQPTSE